MAHTSTNSWICCRFVCEETQRKKYSEALKLDVAVDDEDLQSVISAIVALEHSEAVSTVKTEVQESDD